MAPKRKETASSSDTHAVDKKIKSETDEKIIPFPRNTDFKINDKRVVLKGELVNGKRWLYLNPIIGTVNNNRLLIAMWYYRKDDGGFSYSVTLTTVFGETNHKAWAIEADDDGKTFADAADAFGGRSSGWTIEYGTIGEHDAVIVFSHTRTNRKFQWRLTPCSYERGRAAVQGHLLRKSNVNLEFASGYTPENAIFDELADFIIKKS